MNFGDALQTFIMESRDHISLLVGQVAVCHARPTPEIKSQRLTGRLFTLRRKAEETTDQLSAALLQKSIAETENRHLSLGKTDLLSNGLTTLPSIPYLPTLGHIEHIGTLRLNAYHGSDNTAIVAAIELKPWDCNSDSKESLQLSGETLPDIGLHDYLALAGQRTEHESMVVVRYAGQKTGLGIDKLMDKLQPIIKRLGGVFSKTKEIGVPFNTRTTSPWYWIRKEGPIR